MLWIIDIMNNSMDTILDDMDSMDMDIGIMDVEITDLGLIDLCGWVL